MPRANPPLLQKLASGDRRSLGRVAEVVAEVLAAPRLFRAVFNGMLADAAVLRLRATDAVEKITVTPPEYLLPYKAKLLAEVASSEQQEVRWHVAQLFSRPPWNARECRKIVKILEEYLRDRSSIVKTNAMQALADLVVQDRSLRLALLKKIERLTRTGSPAMQSRGRKLLKQLREL